MAVRQNAPSVLTSNDVSLRMNGILLLATPAQDDRCVVGPGLPLGRLPNSIEVYKNFIIPPRSGRFAECRQICCDSVATDGTEEGRKNGLCSGLTRGTVSLTHRSIEALRPAEAPYRVSDQRCIGLAVRVAPSGV